MNQLIRNLCFAISLASANGFSPMCFPIRAQSLFDQFNSQENLIKTNQENCKRLKAEATYSGTGTSFQGMKVIDNNVYGLVDYGFIIGKGPICKWEIYGVINQQIGKDANGHPILLTIENGNLCFYKQQNFPEITKYCDKYYPPGSFY